MNRWARQVLELLDFKRYSRRTQLWITVITAVVLSAGVLLSWERLGLALTELRLWPALLVLFTAPLTFLLSASEYRLLASAIGSQRSWREAGEISIVGYASNLLPVPGGALVRISALAGSSRPLKQPTQMTLVVALIWLGMALVVGGAGFQASDRPALGLAVAIAGAGLLVLAVAVARPLNPRPSARSFQFRAIALELGSVLLAAARTYLAFRVIGVEAPFAAAMVVAASSALSSAIGVVPAGLGIREGFAAVLASLTGISPAAGLLAAVVLRISGMLVAVVGSASMTARRTNSDSREDPYRESH